MVTVAEEHIGNRIPRYLGFLGSNFALSPPIWTSPSGAYSWVSPHPPLLHRTLVKEYSKALWHDLCSFSMMTHNQAINLCLNTILSYGPEYLRELKGSQVPSANGVNGIHKKRTQSPHEPRKKLIDAATRLIHLLTGSEEYLDHLANSVSLHNEI